MILAHGPTIGVQLADLESRFHKLMASKERLELAPGTLQLAPMAGRIEFRSNRRLNPMRPRALAQLPGVEARPAPRV